MEREKIKDILNKINIRIDKYEEELENCNQHLERNRMSYKLAMDGRKTCADIDYKELLCSILTKVVIVYKILLYLISGAASLGLCLLFTFLGLNKILAILITFVPGYLFCLSKEDNLENNLQLNQEKVINYTKSKFNIKTLDDQINFIYKYRSKCIKASFLKDNDERIAFLKEWEIILNDRISNINNKLTMLNEKKSILINLYNGIYTSKNPNEELLEIEEMLNSEEDVLKRDLHK